MSYQDALDDLLSEQYHDQFSTKWEGRATLDTKSGNHSDQVGEKSEKEVEAEVPPEKHAVTTYHYSYSKP